MQKITSPLKRRKSDQDSLKKIFRGGLIFSVQKHTQRPTKEQR